MALKDIRDLHYDVKFKLNKIDSQRYANFEVPEIDWGINDAYNLLVNSYYDPRARNRIQELGFEVNQRLIDDLKGLVLNDEVGVDVSKIDAGSYLLTLPTDYMHFLSMDVSIEKNGCISKSRVSTIQHDDLANESFHSKSSFEWRKVNARFYNKGIRLFSDETFTIEKAYLNYLKIPKVVHYAESFGPNGYELPNGEILTGFQSFEVSSSLLAEISDLTVVILSGIIEGNYNVKMNKFNLN